MARRLLSPRLVRAETASAIYHCYDWAIIIIGGDRLFFHHSYDTSNNPTGNKGVCICKCRCGHAPNTTVLKKISLSEIHSSDKKGSKPTFSY